MSYEISIDKVLNFVPTWDKLEQLKIPLNGKSKIYKKKKKNQKEKE